MSPSVGTAARAASVARSGSALDDVDRQPSLGGFLVLGKHVVARLAHRFDDDVQAHGVTTVPPQGHARGVDRLDRCDGVALDARYLDESGHGIAGEPQGVLHRDFRGVLDLLRAPAQCLSQACRRHRRRGADLALAADLGPRDGGVRLDERADRGGREQEVMHEAAAALPR